HNGDAVDTAQLHERLERLLTLPALSKLFISVARIEVTHPQCLISKPSAFYKAALKTPFSAVIFSLSALRTERRTGLSSLTELAI
ncbi:hypothetical protein MJM43_31345, partial [Salmonella enterica subsp. enterica serovar Montevideo]|nr:hypothetical protein [Salmonella enterica subsp. enterica serovar Montevideo]